VLHCKENSVYWNTKWKTFVSLFLCFFYFRISISLLYSLSSVCLSSLYKNVSVSWNCRIFSEQIIYLLATNVSVEVSSNLLRSRLFLWLFLRSFLCSDLYGQWSRICCRVSGSMSQLHCSDSNSDTLALFRKCLSLVLSVQSCISIELSALYKPLYSLRIAGSDSFLT
jgi:hypothetical protein